MNQTAEVDQLWIVAPPSEWPSTPLPMSFSTLTAIESCPRKWALSNARYSSIWAERGYPERVYPGTLVGQVVHGVLERIVPVIAEGGGAAAGPEATVKALRRLGGISAVLSEQCERVVERTEGNPRLKASGRDVRQELRERLPAMRLQVQLMLSKLGAVACVAGAVKPTASATTEQSYGVATRRVHTGANAEVLLRSGGGLWKGIADLIIIDDAGAEIADYKTGERKPEHAMQLQLYARLFEEDEEVNPVRHPVKSLRVIYRDGELAVSVPEGQQRAALAAELDGRAKEAKDRATMSPPPTQPSNENCQFCSVRQLCDAYWTLAINGAGDATKWVDAELRVHEQRAEAIWSTTAVSVPGMAVGASVFVRVSPDASFLDRRLRNASHVRIVGASWLEGGDDGEAMMLGVTRNSEIFVVE